MRFEIRSTNDLKQLNKTLRNLQDGKELGKELSAGLRAELKPVVAAVKAAYGGGSHLRPELVRVTRAEVRRAGRMVGARVRVDGRKMPDKMRSLPAMYEGYKPWRHPVYGDRDNWVAQSPNPTFDRTVKPFEARMNKALQELVDGIIRKSGGPI